jgi:hypothetical protein
MADLVGSLRSEIVESIKIRADFLKWKIVLIAALGAAALGLTNHDQATPELLGFIPLVCAYVDVLCIHTDLRIFVIAKFLRNSGTSSNADSAWYERVCYEHRKALVLEHAALVGMTFLMSILICLLVGLSDHLPNVGGHQVVVTAAGKWFLIATSAIGMVVSLCATAFSWRCRKKMSL